MNSAQAALVLAVLQENYHHVVSKEEAAVWHRSALERVDFDLGQRTALRLTETDQFWPTPARFSEMRRALEADIPPERQLPEQRPTEPVWRAGLAKARQALKEAKSTSKGDAR